MAHVTKRMTAQEVAAVLAYVETKLRFKVGATPPIDAGVVASWKEDFDAANCGHYHIMMKAVGRFFRTSQAQFGVTPDALIRSYKDLTRRIVDHTPDWDILPPEDRAAILADPAAVAYANGEIGTAEYAALSDGPGARAIVSGERFRAEAERRGLPNPERIGRLD